MPNDKNIRKYTAADIEKYWKGELSLSAMHALEKAAMDDPFLADALEGYQHAKDPRADLEDLRNRLSGRTSRRGGALPGIYRNTWFRAAAAVIIVASLGILGSQLFRVDETKEIAKSERKQPAPSSIPSNDSQEIKEQDTITDSLSGLIEEEITAETGENPDDNKIKSNKEQSLSFRGLEEKKINQDHPIAAEDSGIHGKAPLPTEPKAMAAGADNSGLRQRKVADANDAFLKKKEITVESAERVEGLNNTQVFYGRVVDAQNNPLPFANVMNLKDRVGTYTDIRGNFNLISKDTAMDLQVKSLGYETKKYRVEASDTPASLVMRVDLLANNNAYRKPIPKLTILSKNRTDSLEEEEESEPEIGWDYYDTYITNNLKYQKADWTNQLAGIELSFQVNQYGRPTNIKVIKSSKCRECNQEAIRLLKEGPNWIRKGKKKTTVTIGVEN